jgi:hypothetical protein
VGGSKSELVGAAAGYALFDLRGRRIGSVIELVDDPESGGPRLAIRRDGVFLWRRRLLPLEAIETVDAERRFVVVDEDREAAGGAAAREATNDNLLRRLDAYKRPENVTNDEGAARGLDEEEPSVPLPTPAASNRYLQFVSTPNGYRLEEQDGQPPEVGTGISGVDLPEPHIVVKVGPSPLPHDRRVCVFLEREIPLAASPARSRA